MTCRCNCGYTCGDPGRCPAPTTTCIREHYVRDCDHAFEGWREEDWGGTAVCKHCGLTAMSHDMASGP